MKYKATMTDKENKIYFQKLLRNDIAFFEERIKRDKRKIELLKLSYYKINGEKYYEIKRRLCK